MPAFLLSHGLSVERIGVVLAAGIVIRIASGPAIGRLADRLRRRKQALTVAAALSGFVGWAYTIAFGFLPLLGVSMAHAAATASLAPLSDALSVAAASEGRGFQYGWVRGAGSAAFVVGTLLSGQLVDRFGLTCIIVTSSVLFLAVALCAARVGTRREDTGPSDAAAGAFRSLWAISVYRRMILIAVLVIGSHALNDAFAVISWRAAGYSSGVISLLWSELWWPRLQCSSRSAPGSSRAWVQYVARASRLWPASFVGASWAQRPGCLRLSACSRCTASPSRCCTSSRWGSSRNQFQNVWRRPRRPSMAPLRSASPPRR